MPLEADHAALEVAELLLRAPALDRLGQLRILDDPIGHAEHRQRQVEDHAQDEADREVAREERRHHADREHRQADEPVADVGADEQADVGRAQAVAEHQVNREHREQQRDRVNRHGRQVLAEHDVEVAGRQREQQLVGVLPALFGPDAHRDRRDEHQQNERQPLVELVEVGQVVAEEIGRPERGQRAEHHEHADEHVSGRIGEIADEVAAKDRFEDGPVHGGEFRVQG